MYCEYWQLKQMPFENVPDPWCVYFSANHDEALTRLFYAAKGQKGACMLTGVIGSGKTTISKVFQEKLKTADFEIGMVTNPNLNSIELLQEILFQLGLECHETSKFLLLRSLNEKILENSKNGKKTVIIIDEAHLIKDIETYEELRLLLNLQHDNRFLITLVLVGQPELRDTIRKIPQFEQRIPIKFHLEPLDFRNTCRYVAFRLRKAGIKKNIFTYNAAKKLFQYSEGVPRKINNICDMSLLVGFVDQVKTIDDALVTRVLAEEG